MCLASVLKHLISSNSCLLTLLGAESSQIKETTPSSHGKESTKSGSLTHKHNKRLQGYDDLCSVYVLSSLFITYIRVLDMFV